MRMCGCWNWIDTAGRVCRVPQPASPFLGKHKPPFVTTPWLPSYCLLCASPRKGETSLGSVKTLFLQ